MTAQWYADAERNLRKTVGLALKPIKANYQLGLLLTTATRGPTRSARRRQRAKTGQHRAELPDLQ